MKLQLKLNLNLLLLLTLGIEICFMHVLSIFKFIQYTA